MTHHHVSVLLSADPGAMRAMLTVVNPAIPLYTQPGEEEDMLHFDIDPGGRPASPTP